jgi:hypothetical protein
MNWGPLLPPSVLDGGGGGSTVSGQLLNKGIIPVQSGKCGEQRA